MKIKGKIETTDVIDSSLTASKIVLTDANKKLVSSTLGEGDIITVESDPVWTGVSGDYSTTDEADALYRQKIAKVLIVDAGGKGDYATLAGAIAVVTSGDTIQLMPGTYAENNLTLPAGVDLTGAGRGVSKISSDYNGYLLACAGNNRVSGITFSNLDTTGGNTIYDIAGGSSNVFIRDCEISAGFDGIHVYDDASGLWVIENNYFTGCLFDGIASRGTNTIIRNNIAIYSPTNADLCSFVNHAKGGLKVSNNIAILSRAADEGNLCFIKGGPIVGLHTGNTTYSYTNKATISAGTKNAYGFGANELLANAPIFYSYNDDFTLTGASTYHANGFNGTDKITVYYIGGNLTTSNNATMTPLTQGAQQALNFISNVATGTQPFACTSTTLNTNLNADLWDGYHFASYLNQAVLTTSNPQFSTLGVGIAAGGQVLNVGYGHMKFTTVADPVAGCTAANSATAGVVTTGTHKYVVSFVTATGQTSWGGVKSNEITADGTKKVDLTNIPIGGTGVTQRKVYRHKAGADGWYYLLTNGIINDNTTTILTDNDTDDLLSATDASYFALENDTTAGKIYIDSNAVFYSGTSSFYAGLNAGAVVTTAFNNVAIGAGAFDSATTCYSNVVVGRGAGQALTIGAGHTLIGDSAGYSLTGDTYNCTGIGRQALNNTTGRDNTAIGKYAGYVITTGTYNTCLGSLAGYTGTTVGIARSTLIGYNAQCTTSNTLVLGGGVNAASADGFSSIRINGLTDTDIAVNFYGTTNSGLFTWMEDEDYFKFSDDIMMLGGENIVLDTTTGTKIGTATSQLLGFYNATPVNQPDTVADPSGGVVIDAESRTAIIAIIDRLQELGLVA